MIDATRTTSMLLESLHDPNHDGAWAGNWMDGTGRYSSTWAAAQGLSDADSADAAQETLADFSHAYRQQRYDRTRGRLRQFLIGIARLKIADLQRARARAGAFAGTAEKTRRTPSG